MAKSNFVIKQHTRQRCQIHKLTPQNQSQFSPVSLELYAYLYELARVDFSMFFRVGSEMIEYMRPQEFCKDYLEHIWKATQKSGADVDVCVMNKDLPKFNSALDTIRRRKMNTLKAADSSLDPKTLDVFADLSGASQMIVKGGINVDVANKAKAAAAYMMNNLMKSQAAMGTLSRMIQIDPTLYDHSAAVAMFSGLMAVRFSDKINEKQAAVVAQCGLYHDTGKSCIPSAILNKPGSFTDDEYEIVKGHTHHGHEELHKAKADGAPIADIVCRVALEHHERFDGHGYPFGKKGRAEEDPENGIHMYTRFVSIADAYSALLMKRVYKPALSSEEAIHLMSKNAPKDFDMAIYESFIGDVKRSLAHIDQNKGRIIDLDEVKQAREEQQKTKKKAASNTLTYSGNKGKRGGTIKSS